MTARRLAVVLMVACLAGPLCGAEGENSPSVPPLAPVDPRGAPPEAPAAVGPAGAASTAPLPPPPPSAVPPATGTSPEVSGQGTPDRRSRLRGRLRAKLKGLLHGGN
jgi:hypothetical protein